MPLVNLGSFAAGLAVGWAGRSLAGSTREALVRAVVAGHLVKNDARRALAERVEWVEDLLAEGRIRYEETIGRARVTGEPAADAAFWSAEPQRAVGFADGESEDPPSIANRGGRAA